MELNYGLIPNGQLTIGVEAAFDNPAGSETLLGYGEVSFKYRFIEEEKNGLRPQLSIFPLVQLPTGRVAHTPLDPADRARSQRNVVFDKMGGHIFRIEDGLIRRVDIR